MKRQVLIGNFMTQGVGETARDVFKFDLARAIATALQ
jgi:hypothetical protein